MMLMWRYCMLCNTVFTLYIAVIFCITSNHVIGFDFSSLQFMFFISMNFNLCPSFSIHVRSFHGVHLSMSFIHCIALQCLSLNSISCVHSLTLVSCVHSLNIVVHLLVRSCQSSSQWANYHSCIIKPFNAMSNPLYTYSITHYFTCLLHALIYSFLPSCLICSRQSVQSIHWLLSLASFCFISVQFISVELNWCQLNSSHFMSNRFI